MPVKFAADTTPDEMAIAEKNDRRTNYDNKRRKHDRGDKRIKNPGFKKVRFNDRFSNTSLRAKDVIARYRDEDDADDDDTDY